MDQSRPERPAQVRGARSHPAKVSQATYWRRRIAVFGAAAGLLTALSWAVNGMLTASSTAGQTGPPGRTGAAGSPTAHVSESPAATAPSPSPRPSSAPAKHRAARQAHAPAATHACASGSVALTVSSPQYFYQPGKTPRFTVRAVAQGSRPCRLNMSPRFVSVVIADGDRRLWSSADCASGASSNMTVIASGKPAALRVSWDRRTSPPGCSGSGHLVRPGQYQVSAVAGRLHSRTVNFVLGAKGVAGP
jgi:hypothetical protein